MVLSPAHLIQSLLLIVSVRLEVQKQKGTVNPLQRFQVMRDTSLVMGEVKGPMEGQVTQLLFKSVSETCSTVVP